MNINKIATAAAVFFCGTALFTPTAIADPLGGDTDVLICNELLLGARPGQIAEQLHESAPTFTRQMAINRVWTVLPTCPND